MPDDDSLNETAERAPLAACEPCGGEGKLHITGQGGRAVDEVCPFCKGLGVVTPAGLIAWAEYLQTGRRPKPAPPTR